MIKIVLKCIRVNSRKSKKYGHIMNSKKLIIICNRWIEEFLNIIITYDLLLFYKITFLISKVYN